MHSPDLIKANIGRLLELFPNCVTHIKGPDGAFQKSIDFDQLRQELSDQVVDGPRERYQLNWPGKRQAILASNSPIAKTLRPCREESVNFDTTKNLFIEGDNLDVLKLLQETYLNKVKLIYIDPPYNTGHDFIYDDDFAESAITYFQRSSQCDESGNRLIANSESNGRFHSDWLSMLYPRLRLSRNLLRNDGAIFVSIDSNEAANLQLIMDDVFGRNNCVTQLVWQKRVSPANDATWFSSDHDLILVYAKDKGIWRPNKLKRNEDQLSYYKNPDNDPRGPWNSATYTCNKSKEDRPNLYYPITNPNTLEQVWPKETAVWKYGAEVTASHIAQGRLYWGANGRAAFPRIKLYLSEMDDVVPRSVWSSDEAGHTQAATTELKSLFDGDTVFDSPKPVKLLKRIISIGCSEPCDIVLDFFGGSGTTAHAAMEQALSGNPCRFVVVQLPEPARSGKYASIADITKERIRRAGKLTLERKGEHIDSVDIGFRVLKVDTSNIKQVYYKPDSLKKDELFDIVDNIKVDRTPEDLVFQVLLDWGVDLSLPIEQEVIDGKTVFFVDQNALVACFDNELTEDLVKKVATRKPMRVVFRDSSFSSDSAKINVEQIFKLMSPGTEVKSI